MYVEVLEQHTSAWAIIWLIQISILQNEGQDSLPGMDMISEYIVIPAKIWSTFATVARAKGLDFVYSEEDGGEYHIYSQLDEAETILWAIEVLEDWLPQYSRRAACMICG